MKNEKFLRFVIIFIIVLPNMLLLSACGNTADKQKIEEENVEINSMEEAVDRNKYPVYLVESIENLHLDSEEFAIENYFIRNECQYSNHYYIDSDNVLWGYGDNEYGQLGNGQQYSRDADGEYRSERTPQKIAENVIHVDFGGYFVIFLTENGELYGIGANLNGVMGMELSEYYTETPAVTVVTEPVCLMQDVTYARASGRGVVALKNDGSVWWWGEIRTTSAKNIKDTKGVSYTKPTKMLDDAIYVTCGAFSIAAIKEDGTLWTWGNNTFGSCGYDSNDKDFIEEPVMVLEDVKMVWMDEARFDTLEKRLGNFISPYTCDYTYVTFAEKKDGTLLACGYEVEGEGSKSWTYMLYGDILRTPDQMNGGEYEPVTVGYSDIFQRIEFREKDRNPQLQFKDLAFGMAPEEVTEFLDGLDIDYEIVDGISDEEKVYEIVTKDQYFRFCFDDKHELTAIHYNAYGTRNGKIAIGMTREEVEAALGKSCFDEIYLENNRYVTAFYQDDNIYEVGYSDGIVYYVEESMTKNMPEDNTKPEESGEQVQDKLDADGIIEEQSFQVELNDWGEVRFVSYESDSSKRDPHEDVTFYLMKDGEILYQFPYIGENHSSGYGLFWDVKFVMFTDTNADGKEDVVIGAEYMTGAGPQGAIPHTRVRIYEDCGDYFIYNGELSDEINDYLPWESNVLAKDIKRLLQLTNGNEPITNYESYTGKWTVAPGYVAAYENPMPESGNELTCSIRNGNEFYGNLYMEQEVAERLASVEGIAGTIQNGELFYEFTDDGWGGAGTLHIMFLPNQINVEILNYQMSEENAIGYEVSESYEMTIREWE